MKNIEFTTTMISIVDLNFYDFLLRTNNKEEQTIKFNLILFLNKLLSYTMVIVLNKRNLIHNNSSS